MIFETWYEAEECFKKQDNYGGIYHDPDEQEDKFMDWLHRGGHTVREDDLIDLDEKPTNNITNL